MLKVLHAVIQHKSLLDILVLIIVSGYDLSTSLYCFQMFADRGFSAPLHRTANYLTRHKPNSTYMYTFEFDVKEYYEFYLNETNGDCGYWHGT